MPLNTKKDFWVRTINNLLNYKAVDPANLTEGTDWENKLRTKPTWREIETYAMNVCQDIYVKATVNQSPFPIGGVNPFLNEMGENTVRAYWNNVWNTVHAYGDLASVLRDKIGVDPEDNTLATDDAGNNIQIDGVDIPRWKNFIESKLPIKLTDIGNLDLADLMYNNDLYSEIVHLHTGLMEDILTRGLTDPNKVHKYTFNWNYKVDRDRIQEYKDAETDLLEAGNRIKTILGLAPTDPVSNNWHTLLARQDDLDTAAAAITTLITERDNYKTERDAFEVKSDEYDRIHAKLSGKVSDSELDNLLNSTPQCSHTDYDTIKTERDTLNTEKKEINKKITSELGLAENSTLAQILAKVKELMKTPDTSDKDSKITELQTQITQKDQTIADLQQQKPTAEIKNEIIKNSKELGIFTEAYQQKLEQVSSYQELSEIQQAAFKDKLLEKETALTRIEGNTKQLRVGLGILLVVMVLTLGGMGYYLTNKKKRLKE